MGDEGSPLINGEGRKKGRPVKERDRFITGHYTKGYQLLSRSCLQSGVQQNVTEVPAATGGGMGVPGDL